MFAAARPVVRAQAKRFSTSAVARGHGPDQSVRGWHIPFNYQNKGGIAFKTVTYLSFGFSIPFLAAWYQLKKSGAA